MEDEGIDMQPIVYDVAVSIDGYISGPDGDISRFPREGAIVDDYGARLASYDVAIMGRRTYEFGYCFGLKPGQNPYEHMRTHVFSGSLDLPETSDVTLHRTSDVRLFRKLKDSSGGPIYLCGGGAFAGSLLSLGLIDSVRLKRAPVVLGGGVSLFGDATISPALRHIETRQYPAGYLYQEFELQS